jgi:hypothetical protein
MLQLQTQKPIKINIPFEWFLAAANVTGIISTNRSCRSTLAQDAATKNYVDTALNSSNVLASKNMLWETLTVKLQQ